MGRVPWHPPKPRKTHGRPQPSLQPNNPPLTPVFFHHHPRSFVLCKSRIRPLPGKRVACIPLPPGGTTLPAESPMGCPVPLGGVAGGRCRRAAERRPDRPPACLTASAASLASARRLGCGAAMGYRSRHGVPKVPCCTGVEPPKGTGASAVPERPEPASASARPAPLPPAPPGRHRGARPGGGCVLPAPLPGDGDGD